MGLYYTDSFVPFFHVKYYNIYLLFVIKSLFLKYHLILYFYCIFSYTTFFHHHPLPFPRNHFLKTYYNIVWMYQYLPVKSLVNDESDSQLTIINNASVSILHIAHIHIHTPHIHICSVCTTSISRWFSVGHSFGREIARWSGMDTIHENNDQKRGGEIVLAYIFLYPSQTRWLREQTLAPGCTGLDLGLASVSQSPHL